MRPEFLEMCLGSWKCSWDVPGTGDVPGMGPGVELGNVLGEFLDPWKCSWDVPGSLEMFLEMFLDPWIWEWVDPYG
jgi:hypothetical protein